MPPAPAQVLPTFLARGFAPFKAEYDAASVLLGRTVRFVVGAGEGDSVQRVTGRVTGVGDDGRLQLVTDGGETREFLSGEVSSVELADGHVISAALDDDGHSPPPL